MCLVFWPPYNSARTMVRLGMNRDSLVKIMVGVGRTEGGGHREWKLEGIGLVSLFLNKFVEQLPREVQLAILHIMGQKGK